MKTSIRCASAAILAASLLSGAATARQRLGTPDPVPLTPSTLLPVATRWTVTLPAPAAAAPVASGDRLFAALFDGRVVAVSLVDGSELWQVEQPVVGQPAAGGGLFHAATPAGLVALDAETGDVRWASSQEASVSAPLLWTAGWLIAGLETGVLLALHAGIGGVVWMQVFDGGISVRPTIAGDRLYLSLDSGRIAALELLTGEVVWERPLGGAPREILVAGDLFVGATDNHFYRLSRLDGALRWRWRAGGDVAGLPAVDDEHVYFSSLDNILWALDRSHGGQRWRELLPVRPSAGPRHAEDLIMQGGLSRELNLRGPTDGTVYHRLQVSSELAFAPLAVPDPLSEGPLVLLLTADGELQAVGRASGPERLDPAVTTAWEKFFAVAEEDGDSGGDTDDAGDPAEPADAPEGETTTVADASEGETTATADAPDGETATAADASEGETTTTTDAPDGETAPAGAADPETDAPEPADLPAPAPPR